MAKLLLHGGSAVMEVMVESDTAKPGRRKLRRIVQGAVFLLVSWVLVRLGLKVE